MPRKRKPKEIRANRIVLEDLSGKTKALFDASEEDFVTLQLYSSDRPCLVACIDTDGNPKLSFFDQTGRVALALGIADDLGPGITIHDASGCPLCFIRVGKDGVPAIALLERTAAKSLRKLWVSPKPKKTRIA